MDVTPESVCIGKAPHDTKESAATSARAQRAKHGGRWHSYRCPFCEKHHVGHLARVKGHGIGGKSARKSNRHDDLTYA